MDVFLVAALAVLLVLWAALRRRRRKTAPYELVRSLGLGDLSEAHLAARGPDRFVLKIPRVPGLADLPRHERAVLDELAAKGADTVYGRALPWVIETFPLEGRPVNVFPWREGYRTALEIRERFPGGVDGRHVAWMFNRTLEVLGFVHRAGWVHGAVLPPHLLFHPEDHGLLLVGWIHAVRPKDVLGLVPTEYADWYPDEVRDREGVTPSVDLYLAARTMLWLGGSSLPASIARFLRGCLLESPSMRPQDAWQLREEFRAVLEAVYGAPRFLPLILK